MRVNRPAFRRMRLRVRLLSDRGGSTMSASRLFSVLVLAVLLPRGPGPGVADEPPKDKPLTAEQKEKLKERDRLSKEAHDLEQARKFADAVAAAEKALAIEREVYGDLHDNVAKSLKFLADL